jgi:hypothetical protein
MLDNFRNSVMNDTLKLIIDQELIRFFEEHNLKNVKFKVEFRRSDNNVTFHPIDNYSMHIAKAIADKNYIRQYKLKLLKGE